MRKIASALAVLATLALPAVAGGDVLIDTQHLSGGRCIRLGIWNKPYDGGNHPTVEASVYRGVYQPRSAHPAQLIAKVRLTATSTWTTHTLACPAPGHYTVVLVGWGWHRSYPSNVS
jgi:hypothetical protein